MIGTVNNEGIICLRAQNCPLCGSTGKELYRDLRDPLFGSPGVWNLRQCINGECGSGWVDPMPAIESLPDLYNSYHTHVAVEAVFPGIKNAEQIKKKRDFLARFMPWWRLNFDSELRYFGFREPGTILDVGCGAGGFLQTIVGVGWVATGVDFDPQAVATARERSGAEVYVADVFDPSFDKRRFDGILLDNVIEHVPFPKETVARCAELLTPGGRLVLITPNFEANAKKRYGEHWRGLETPRHLQLFTKRSLHRLVTNAGLASVKAFGSPSMAEFNFMVGASEQIMRSRGLPVKRWPFRKRLMCSRSFMSALFGGSKAEFLVCVAERPSR